MAIKLLGIIATKLAEYDEQGNETSPAEYADDNYYAMSHERIESLAEVTPDRQLPSFVSNTHYYAFADEADAKQQLNYDEETDSFDVSFLPSVEEQVQAFKQSRQEQLDSAVVTTQSGKQFDADENSINRMDFAISAATRKGKNLIQWSTADVETGVKVDVTVSELEEAHDLAVENMDRIWGVE